MNRAELARDLMVAIVRSNQPHSPEGAAEWAVRSTDALLAALNITPETVVESQQVQAGIVQLRYIGPSGMGITNGNVYSGVRSSDNFNFRDNHNNHRRILLSNFEVIDNA